MGKQKQKGFDVTVVFCGVDAETPELAMEKCKQELRETFKLLPTQTVRTPWAVTQAVEV